MDLLFFYIVIMLAIAFLLAVLCLYMAIKSRNAQKNNIKMLKVKTLQVVESRFLATDSAGSFAVQHSIAPTQIDFNVDSATWREETVASSSGIYAYHNVLKFKIPNKSLARRALRAKISAIVTLENNDTFLVDELAVVQSWLQRIGLTKTRNYTYRCDNLRRAPHVEISTTASGVVVIKPRSAYYNHGGGIGTHILGI